MILKTENATGRFLHPGVLCQPLVVNESRSVFQFGRPKLTKRVNGQFSSINLQFLYSDLPELTYFGFQDSQLSMSIKLSSLAY